MSRFKEAIKRFFHWRGAGFIIILAFFLGMLCLYPGNNVFTWISARRDIADQKRQMRRLDKEIISMQNEIDVLTGNKDSLERFARENFHFTAPGEEVYLIDEK